MKTTRQIRAELVKKGRPVSRAYLHQLRRGMEYKKKGKTYLKEPKLEEGKHWFNKWGIVFFTEKGERELNKILGI